MKGHMGLKSLRGREPGDEREGREGWMDVETDRNYANQENQEKQHGQLQKRRKPMQMSTKIKREEKKIRTHIVIREQLKSLLVNA